MRLLHVSTFETKEFIGLDTPPYAILSHTWGPDEVTYRDITKQLEAAKKKVGFAKIEACCRQARLEGLEWIWVDTCLIDKRSSAELSEAINSMFVWYQNALICYAYLDDIYYGENQTHSIPATLSNSRWFTRGWTLQELIAPRKVAFYSLDWVLIGNKYHDEANSKFVERLASITGIGAAVLKHRYRFFHCSVAQRMSWAAKRSTTRAEDWAYSLMGLFDVHMPIIYGEGLEKAFKRLQLEILKTINDETIFAWRSRVHKDGSLLATTPKNFVDCDFTTGTGVSTSEVRPFTMTNVGLQITLPLSPLEKQPGLNNVIAVASLTAWTVPIPGEQPQRVQIVLKKLNKMHWNPIEIYQRSQCNILLFAPTEEIIGSSELIYVVDDVQADHLEASGAISPSFTRRVQTFH